MHVRCRHRSKNLLVLATPNNFNEDTEAEITLVIENLLSKLSLKNKKQNKKVKEVLNSTRRNLATLSKKINEELYQKTSALMIENLDSLLKEMKCKHF
jgi:BMFP domain-containing protein YqiC